jgi:hypothetical protein
MDTRIGGWDDASIHVGAEALIRGVSVFEGIKLMEIDLVKKLEGRAMPADAPLLAAIGDLCWACVRAGKHTSRGSLYPCQVCAAECRGVGKCRLLRNAAREASLQRDVV